ncbi:MAG: radical SAM family heme chaperone HemW [Cyanobacteria bacterium J06633_2]
MDDERLLCLPRSVYIHIPFCRRRCYYCDFPIAVVGDRPPLPRTDGETTGHGSSAISRYVDRLCAEMSVAPIPPEPLQTVFFGGGTPSLLSVTQLNSILNAIRQRFAIAPTAECSMEMDPGTFTQEQINGYVSFGINRVSLGVQAFQSHLLKQCGRTHTPDDIEHAIAMLQCAGVTNYSIDLMSGLPDQSMDDWQDSLERAIALSPPHISIYDLTVEPGTAFDRWYELGQAPLPSDSTTAAMYRHTQQMLTHAGYEHYEISNYAKPGYQCRHNHVYWNNQPYYGFGMGATSYMYGQRVSRPRTQESYATWVENWIAHNGILDHPVTSEEESLLDTLMVGLRLARGIDVEVLRQRFGDRPVDTVVRTLTSYIPKGWVEWIAAPTSSPIPTQPDTPDIFQSVQSSHHRIRLTDPEGFLFSNVVLSDLFARLTET